MVAGRNAAAGGQVAADLRADGAHAAFVEADISDPGQARAAVEATIGVYGRIDGLVNSAGLTTRGTLLDTTPELFDQHIAVNLRGPFFLMQAAVADMVSREAPGAIVNIISISAHAGQAYLAPYVAAKAGLIGLTRNVAHAHRWDRIRVNGLNIGWTDTEGEDATQRTFHGAADGAAAGRGVAADGPARPGRGDRRLRGVPAVGPERRGDRLGHRLGPERHRGDGLAGGSAGEVTAPPPWHQRLACKLPDRSASWSLDACPWQAPVPSGPAGTLSEPRSARADTHSCMLCL